MLDDYKEFLWVVATPGVTLMVLVILFLWALVQIVPPTVTVTLPNPCLQLSKEEGVPIPRQVKK